MKPLQKIIKYLALAFAVFLIVNIFSAILLGLHIFADVLNLNKKEQISDETSTTNFENIASLNVQLEYSNLIIKSGDTLKSEINGTDITCNQNNNQLILKQEKHNWFSKGTKSQAIIYIPANITFDKVFIQSGAGKLEIENISSKELSLEIGAGKVNIKNLNILNNAKIEGGVRKS